MLNTLSYWLYYWPLRWIPFRMLNIGIGHLARLESPAWLIQMVIKLYIRFYAINMEDFGGGPYRSFNAFFTRAVSSEKRPIASNPQAILSPCDGTAVQCDRVTAGTLLQVKHHRYSLAALLGEPENSPALQHYEAGWSITIYLSPRDYHCFHSPCDAVINCWRSIAGSFWSVSPPAQRGVPKLFARNARLVTYLQPSTADDAAQPPIAFVAVGAAVVSSIEMAFGECISASKRSHALQTLAAPFHIKRGEKLGQFALGSSIILIFPRSYGTLHPLPEQAMLRMGQEIGICSAHRSPA